MISTKENVRQLVALMKQHGIQNVVLCPGSRNVPITQTILGDDYFNAYSIVDERSAAFVALGMIDETGKPAAVCCSSGTALMNMGSAVCEAYYRALPLLIISADRPMHLLNRLEGQTIPQANIFQRTTNLSVDVDDRGKEGNLFANRLINQALIALTSPCSGPVHINIHFDNPIHDFVDESLAEVRKVNIVPVYPTAELYLPTQAAKDSHKVMVLVGQMPYDKDVREAVKYLKERGCLVLAEPLSNLGAEILDVAHLDMILKAVDRSEWQSLAPDLLITFGGNIVSKRIKELLVRFAPKKHWHISHTFPVKDPDPYDSMTDLFDCKVTDFVESLSLHIDTLEIDKSYQLLWSYLENVLPEPKSLHKASSFAYMQKLLTALPEESNLVLGNSSIVRLSMLFDFPKDTHVFCNRGVSGIDGSLSTALGIALKSDRHTYVFIGDLSLLYDMNVMRQKLPSNMTIVLLNNHGGAIFHEIPALQKADKAVLDDFIASSHTISPKGWAEDNNIVYRRIYDSDELDECLAPSNLPNLIEIVMDIEEQADELNHFMRNIRLNLNN